MEFWGVEVKPGETVKCDPGEDKYLHLSQASLGETKKDKGSENVPVFVKFNDQKLVLGTLSAEKCAQISYDLVFEKEFELSHNSKNTSVYFCGYKTVVVDDEDGSGFPDADSDSEEEILLGQNANGKSVVKIDQPKPTAAKGTALKVDALSSKPKVKMEEPNKVGKPKADEDDDEDDDDEDEDDSEEDESDDDLDMDEADHDSDDEDEDESSDEEDEATPKKAESGKRPAGSALKTPAVGKKAKLVSPVGSQKTGGDGKKGGHTATPYPAKQAGKTTANNDKSKQQTPKSSGSVTCKSCSKTFNSDNALQAHTKAKHSAGK